MLIDDMTIEKMEATFVDTYLLTIAIAIMKWKLYLCLLTIAIIRQ
jgi:hypothetical protein